VGSRGGAGQEAAADGGDERAPVSGGAALRLTAEAKEVVAARSRSGGEKIAAWGQILAGSGGVPFLKGADRGRNRRGVERRGRRVEEVTQVRGVPAGRRAAPGQQRPETGGRARRESCTRCRTNSGGGGETDGWVAATVPGDGAADERGPSGSGRGRERRGTDRWDRPVSGRGRRRGWGLRGARVGRPGKEKGGLSPDE
jgi:hypothetical protein